MLQELSIPALSIVPFFLKSQLCLGCLSKELLIIYNGLRTKLYSMQLKGLEHYYSCVNFVLKNNLMNRKLLGNGIVLFAQQFLLGPIILNKYFLFPISIEVTLFSLCYCFQRFV